MKADDLLKWLPVLAAILAAGMWLGNLQSRVNALDREQHYIHGEVAVPKEFK